jgi:hypothetical protein
VQTIPGAVNSVPVQTIPGAVNPVPERFAPGVVGPVPVQRNRGDSAYDQYMRRGYVATQLGYYQTALANFRSALNERPGDLYATRAIGNLENYSLRRR